MVNRESVKTFPRDGVATKIKVARAAPHCCRDRFPCCASLVRIAFSLRFYFRESNYVSRSPNAPPSPPPPIVSAAKFWSANFHSSITSLPPPHTSGDRLSAAPSTLSATPDFRTPLPARGPPPPPRLTRYRKLIHYRRARLIPRTRHYALLACPSAQPPVPAARSVEVRFFPSPPLPSKNRV